MKRFLILLVLSLLLVLPGCKRTMGGLNDINYGKIDYQVCGLYIRPIDVKSSEEFKIDDSNPKVYFDYSRSNIIFSTKTGSDDAFVVFDSVSKSVNENTTENKITLTGNARLKFLNKDIKEVALYPVIYKDGKILIDTNHYERVKIDTRYNYDTKFVYKKCNYELHISLIF